eukprot:gene8435-8253_t
MAYVLVSRTDEPKHFNAVGLPPADLLDAVARGWEHAGLDVHACFEAAASVSGHFRYDRSAAGSIEDRFSPATDQGRKKNYRIRPLSRIIDPQP